MSVRLHGEPTCTVNVNGTQDETNILLERHASLCNNLSGWTEDEIQSLINKQEVPDHWWEKPGPTLAFFESVRLAIDRKRQPVALRETYLNIFHTLHLNCPKHLGNFLCKVKTKSWSLTKSNNTLNLIYNLPEFSKQQKDQIGDKCESTGITVAWLQNSQSASPVIFTNEMAIEVNKYRVRKNMTWQELADLWPRLVQRGHKPNRGLVKHNFSRLAKRRETLRKKGKEHLSNWLQTPFYVPQTINEGLVLIENDKTFTTEGNVCGDVHQKNDEEYCSSDVGNEGDDNNNDDDDDDWIPPLDREAWNEYEKLQNEQVKNLEKNLTAAQKHMKDISEQLFKREQLTLKLESQRDRFKYEIVNLKSEISALKRQCKTVAEENEALHKQLAQLSPKNLKRKVKLRDEAKKHLQEQNELLKIQISKLEERNSRLFQEKRKFQEKVRRIENKLADEKEGSNKMKDMKRQLKAKDKKLADLEVLVDEVMEKENDTIKTFENGHYTKDIRLTVYELLSMGVGSKNVGTIIETVLQRVGKMQVDRLPKATIVKYMATEQGMLAKHAAYNAINNSTDDITLHTDGTSKKRKHFLTYLASTSDGTVALGLSDIHAETADVMVKEAEEALQGLTNLITSNVEEKQSEMEEMLSKIKNTMTDRAAVNKSFVRKFGEWRAEVMPRVVPLWDTMNSNIQQELIKVNEMYCGKHLVLNIQEYAQSALTEWENVESCGNKLGREKHILWNRGSESATMLAVRSICNCFGPDADPQSGYSFEFSVHLEDRYQTRSCLQEFRGNRFNIPFENATAAFYHIPHIRSLVQTYKETDRNRLMKSCLWDLEDNIVLAGIRAMGLLEKQVSSPLMEMLDSSLHVMDTSKYYERTFNKIKQFMVDPTELLHGQTLLFEDFPPVKDKLWDALFQHVSEEIEDLTSQAIIIIAHSICLCLHRQLSDHLPGGKFYNVSEQVRKETNSVPKHNLAPEYLFSHLDRKKREMPNANTITIEGLILWSMNGTLSFLDSLDSKKADTLVDRARINRKRAIELYQEKRKNIRVETAQKLRQMENTKKSKEIKKMNEIQRQTEKVMEYKICKDVKDIDELRTLVNEANKQLSSSAVEVKFQEAIKSQLRYYKLVNRSSDIDYKLFHFSQQKRPLTTDQLVHNLSKILQFYKSEENQDQETFQEPTSNLEARREKIDQLKRKYTYCDKSPVKKRRSNPFPGEQIIGKRISMKFKTTGQRHHFYKGVILRKSTTLDLQEYLEEEDEDFVGNEDFYTIQFDAPHSDSHYVYPLEKEWDDGCLNLI